MKVQELRDKIKGASKEDADKILTELYKMLSKGRKEEADIIIDSILAHENINTTKTKQNKLDFNELKEEIENFCANVDANYYYVPNRVVPKNKRAKWRFEVKNFVKQLDQVPLDSQDSLDAAKLMRSLYLRLCHGCGYYIFPSENPFRAVGIAQADFYNRVVSRNFALGCSDNKIKEALDDATTVFMDRDTWHMELIWMFVNLLPTNEAKNKAITIAMDEVDVCEEKLSKESKYSNRRYELTDKIEKMCEVILGVGISLGESDDAIKYYFVHSKTDGKEITLYKVLQGIDFFDGGDELWIEAYENAVNKRKIKPRNDLQEKYYKLKEGIDD